MNRVFCRLLPSQVVCAGFPPVVPPGSVGAAGRAHHDGRGL